MTTNGNLILFKLLWGEQNMKTMMVALGMLVLLGGQLASASVDRPMEVKTVKSATSTTAAVGAPIHVAGRMVTSGGCYEATPGSPAIGSNECWLVGKP